MTPKMETRCTVSETPEMETRRSLCDPRGWLSEALYCFAMFALHHFLDKPGASEARIPQYFSIKEERKSQKASCWKSTRLPSSLPLSLIPSPPSFLPLPSPPLPSPPSFLGNAESQELNCYLKPIERYFPQTKVQNSSLPRPESFP